jgi:hypothetical protein
MTPALQDFGFADSAQPHWEQLKSEAASAYRLGFLNDRWLVYRHERLIADFPVENAELALAFLRLRREQFV